MTRRSLLLALLLWLALGVCLPARATTVVGRVTWYPLSQFAGESMANGRTVYEGAFACPRWAMGRTVTIPAIGISGPCEDTGDPGYFGSGSFKLDVAAWSRPWWMDDWMEITVE